MSSTHDQQQQQQQQQQQRRHGGVVRPDGRLKDGVLRPLGCEMSCLSQADGSALWKCGGTHVLGAVYGPVAPQNQSKEHGSRAVLSIIIKSGNSNSNSGSSCGGGGGGSGDNELFESQYEMSDFLHRILSCCIDIERYPRCVIEIVLQIVQSDGSVLGALLHAAVSALMDGGIDLLYLPVATTCLVLAGDNGSNRTEENVNASDTIVRTIIRLDPTSEEEDGDYDSSLLVLVTKQPDDDVDNSSSIIGSHTVGPGISVNDMLSCMNVASKASKAIAAFWRLAVEQKLTRESQTLWSK